MTAEEIKEMFLLSAKLRKLGPFDQKLKQTENRFFELDAKYRSEFLDNEDLDNSQDSNSLDTSQQDWKAALSHIANVLNQFSTVVPESKKMNEYAFAMIAPIVVNHFERNEDESTK